MKLINEQGNFFNYQLSGKAIAPSKLSANSCRVIYSAAHVVANPFTNNDPSGVADIDWQATLKFRHHLADLGLGIAEAMDTAQRGMGLDWHGALELIKQTRQELPNALVANGVGTDHLLPQDTKNLDDVRKAYFHQCDAVQKLDARVILMASRTLAKVATSPDDYINIYGDILQSCDYPVILHWLGPMFDPQLAGYWGSDDFTQSLETVVQIINENQSKIDGIKISLLDKNKEIILRDRLPNSVKMYTGDDFNYPELIQGDKNTFSHALLGIFDPLAPLIASAIGALDKGNNKQFRDMLDPSVPMAREIFRAPTQFYKTGVVFLAWLNGFQDHFIMLGGAHAMRPLPHFCKIFTMADKIGLFSNPDLAQHRMIQLLKNYGV